MNMKKLIQIVLLVLFTTASNGQGKVKVIIDSLAKESGDTLGEFVEKLSIDSGKLIDPVVKDPVDTFEEFEEKFSMDSTESINSLVKKNDDTLSVDLESNKELLLPLTNSNKIILVKDIGGVDYFKYILPVITLFLGIGVNKLLDYFSNKKVVKKSGRRWGAEIRGLEKPMRNQVDELNSFKDDLEKKEFERPTLTLYAILDCEVFKSLDKSSLLDYIELRSKENDFADAIKVSNQTHGYISILSGLYENIKDKYSSFLTGTSLHINALTTNLQLFMAAFAEYGVQLEVELGSEPSEDLRYKPILKLVSEHLLPKISEGHYNPYELREFFFQPLLVILAKLRMDKRTSKLQQVVTSCLNDVKAIEFENRYLVNNINTIVLRYTEQISEIEIILNQIENGKVEKS